MTWSRCSLVFVWSAIVTGEASAQFLPPPIFIGPPPGIGFQYNGGRVRVAGFLPLGGYYYGYGYGYPGFYPPGLMSTRITMQVVMPPVVVRPARPPAPRDDGYDVAGIDLDKHPASKIWGEKPVLAKNVKPVEPAMKPAVAKIEPKKPKSEPLPAPKVDLRPLWQRLTDDGIAAFRIGDYGVALLRFRQAEADPAAARAIFLQAQACVAMGKYRDAVQLIQEGLAKNPKWPGSGFQPKIELYANQNAPWKAHVQQLEAVQKANPKDADYLFLLGYLRWFAGERDAAVAIFQQARLVAADPQWCDLFLKAAKK